MFSSPPSNKLEGMVQGSAMCQNQWNDKKRKLAPRSAEKRGPRSSGIFRRQGRRRRCSWWMNREHILDIGKIYKLLCHQFERYHVNLDNEKGEPVNRILSVGSACLNDAKTYQWTNQNFSGGYENLSIKTFTNPMVGRMRLLKPTLLSLSHIRDTSLDGIRNLVLFLSYFLAFVKPVYFQVCLVTDNNHTPVVDLGEVCKPVSNQSSLCKALFTGDGVHLP